MAVSVVRVVKEKNSLTLRMSAVRRYAFRESSRLFDAVNTYISLEQWFEVVCMRTNLNQKSNLIFRPTNCYGKSHLVIDGNIFSPQP